MTYRLSPATDQDRPWLDRLRRDAYRDLFDATFGGWDEARHLRHFDECWMRGLISIVEVDGRRVGMIQLFEDAKTVEIGEIQILPQDQNRGVGSSLLKDTIARAHEQGKKVALSVGLRNDRAYRLYLRLGFQKTGESDTHNHMSSVPGSDQ